MTQPSQSPSTSIEVGIPPEGEAILSDPTFVIMAAIGLTAYLMGKFVAGRRDPSRPRKWWDYRQID